MEKVRSWLNRRGWLRCECTWLSWRWRWWWRRWRWRWRWWWSSRAGTFRPLSRQWQVHRPVFAKVPVQAKPRPKPSRWPSSSCRCRWSRWWRRGNKWRPSAGSKSSPMCSRRTALASSQHCLQIWGGGNIGFFLSEELDENLRCHSDEHWEENGWLHVESWEADWDAGRERQESLNSWQSGSASAIVMNAVICKMIRESQECSSMWNLDQQDIASRKIEDRLEIVDSHCCSCQFGRQVIFLTAHLNWKAFKSYNRVWSYLCDVFWRISTYFAFLCLSHIKSKGRSKKMEKDMAISIKEGGGSPYFR